jgi:regulatory protein
MLMVEDVRLLKLVRRGDQVNLQLTGFDEPLVVGAEVVARYRLVEGIVLTESQVSQLKRDAELGGCEREIGRLLGLRDHSTGEIRRKLKRKLFSTETVEETVRRYRDRGLIDDVRFAYQHAERLLERNPAGRSYLVAYLRRKGIDRALAESTVDVVMGNQDEIALAVSALERRWRVFRQFDLEKARHRAYTYLSRRGIGYEAARAAFDQMVKQDSR